MIRIHEMLISVISRCCTRHLCNLLSVIVSTDITLNVIHSRSCTIDHSLCNVGGSTARACEHHTSTPLNFL